MITIGQTTAINTEWDAIQELPVSAPTLPKSSRAAPTVEESGFHSAMKPSQPGMSSGATNALVTIVKGKSRPQGAGRLGAADDQAEVDADPQAREPQQQEQEHGE